MWFVRNNSIPSREEAIALLNARRGAIKEQLLALGNPASLMSSPKQRAQLLKELRNIQSALDRIANMSYGECCRCGEIIEGEMLRADLAIPFCSKCAAVN